MPQNLATMRKTMNSCAQCGAPNAGNDTYCIQCGASLRSPKVEARSLKWVPLVLLVGLACVGGVGWLATTLFRDRPAPPLVTATLTPSRTISAADYANPWPSSETLASTAPSTPSPDLPHAVASDMEVQLDEYYRLINAKIFTRAYALRSQRSRRKTSQSEFEKIWSNNRSVSMEDFRVLNQSPDRATVLIKLQADDVDGNSGKSAVTRYQGKVTLVLEEALWRYDGGDFQAEPTP